MAHTSATVSSAAVSPGSGGASSPTAVPGRCSARTVATTPAAHSAERRSTPKAAERARRGQRLGLRRRQPHTGGEVGEVAVGTAAVALGVDRFGQVEPDRADLGQPQPDRQAALAPPVALQDRLGPALG